VDKQTERQTPVKTQPPHGTVVCVVMTEISTELCFV